MTTSWKQSDVMEDYGLDKSLWPIGDRQPQPGDTGQALTSVIRRGTLRNACISLGLCFRV